MSVKWNYDYNSIQSISTSSMEIEIERKKLKSISLGAFQSIYMGKWTTNQKVVYMCLLEEVTDLF